MLGGFFEITPPSLIIVGETRHLITIYSYCMSRGIRIPDDLSVILLVEGKHAPWLYPPPTYFKLHHKAIIKKLITYIEHYPTSPPKPDFLKALMCKGQSLKKISS